MGKQRGVESAKKWGKILLKKKGGTAHIQYTSGANASIPVLMVLSCYLRSLFIFVATLSSVAFDTPHVVSLSRWAVKGLSADTLTKVTLNPGETFPNDRRYALLEEGADESFDEHNPKWLHKSNFLCAFTAASLLRSYRTVFADDTATLTVHPSSPSSSSSSSSSSPETPRPLLSQCLTSPTGCETTSQFFSEVSGKVRKRCQTS